MKKFLLFFAFCGLVSLTAQAQDCHGADKSATTSVEKASCSSTAAAKAASLDESIESRTDAESGKVTYVRKDVCAASGKVSYTEVEYCTKSAKFVNVSPEEKAGCCSSKGAKASSASSKTPACCAGKAKASKTSTSSCTGKDAKSTESSDAAKVKLVKNEGE